MNRSRLLVLGLDGLPLRLAKALASNYPERLPNLARLAAFAGGIEAELPELSPVNWTSFFTGVGPGEHGVYGFTLLDPASYGLRIANFSDVRAPTIFDRLGERGLVSRVLNLPNMAPARPLRGMLVAGFVAPSLDAAVYPPFLLGPLKAAGYRIEGDTTRGSSDPGYLLGQLRQSLDARRAALNLLWPDLAWDLFVCVLTETDRLFHFLFPAVERPGHPLHAACLAFLVQWDALIGAVLERFDALPGPKRLLVLADHGFCSLVQEVDLNRVLLDAGFLRLSRPGRDEWDAGVISADSRAFALDPGRVYLHSHDRFSRGRVAEADEHALKRDLTALLLGLTWEGQRVMNRVLDGRELYATASTGPAPSGQPDLVCVPEPGFDLKAKFDRRGIYGLCGRFGMHRPEDAIFCDTGGATPARVRDVGQLVLEHFGAGGHFGGIVA